MAGNAGGAGAGGNGTWRQAGYTSDGRAVYVNPVTGQTRYGARTGGSGSSGSGSGTGSFSGNSNLSGNVLVTSTGGNTNTGNSSTGSNLVNNAKKIIGGGNLQDAMSSGNSGLDIGGRESKDITGGTGNVGSGRYGGSDPYAAMWEQLQNQINSNYDTQKESATKNKDDYLNYLTDSYAKWLTGEEEAAKAYRDYYQGVYDNTVKRTNEYRDKDIADTNTGYDRSARQNYINYMQAQKQLPNKLNALGINGGARESSLIRLGSNYGTNVANNEAARQTALANLAQQYAKALSDYEQSYQQNLFDYDTEQRSRKAAREEEDRQRVASYLDTYNKLLTDLEAARGSELASGYANATEKGIEYRDAQEQKAYERQQAEAALQRELARQTIEDQRYEQEQERIAQEKALENQRYEDQLAAERIRQQIEDERYAEEQRHALEREGVEDSRYKTEWEYKKAQDEFNNFKDDHANWSASRLAKLIKKMADKDYKTDNKKAKLAYLRGLYDIAIQNEKNNSGSGSSGGGGGGGYSSGGYSGGGYDTGDTDTTPTDTYKTTTDAIDEYYKSGAIQPVIKPSQQNSDDYYNWVDKKNGYK